MKKIFKQLIITIIALNLFLSPVMAIGSNTLSTKLKNLTADSAIVVDAKTGKVLFEKNGEKILPIASLTKLMTALVFLEHNPGWNKVITYTKSDDDVLQYANKHSMAYLKVKIGDQLTVEDLFYSGLVGSANNSIYALIRSTGLSRDEFVNLMNEKAKSLGLTNTFFVEPSGLSIKNVSTAEELAKIATLAWQNDDIRLATSYRWWSFNLVNNGKFHKVRSINKLLTKNLSFKLRGTKTGFLDEAGYCLVAKAQNWTKNKEVIALVLNDSKPKYFNNTADLLKFGLGI